jgi:hypothetical protein
MMQISASKGLAFELEVEHADMKVLFKRQVNRREAYLAPNRNSMLKPIGGRSVLAFFPCIVCRKIESGRQMSS